VILISLVYSNNGANDPFAASDPSLVALDKPWSSLIGVLLNIIGCCIVHWYLIGTLSICKIKDIMKKTQEPIIKYYGAPIYFSGFCAVLASFHLIGDID